MTDIHEISRNIEIKGMTTLRNNVFFFTKDGLYVIELPAQQPWYKRAWEWIIRKTGRRKHV